MANSGRAISKGPTFGDTVKDVRNTVVGCMPDVLSACLRSIVKGMVGTKLLHEVEVGWRAGCINLETSTVCSLLARDVAFPNALHLQFRELDCKGASSSATAVDKDSEVRVVRRRRLSVRHWKPETLE